MPELIDKWEVVNKLIQLENNYQFYKEQWDADVLYRRICELEIGIGKTPGVTVQEWILLEESKPNRDDLVIVFFEGMKDTPAAIQIMYGWCIGGSASHWMPLPQPPKGE